MAHELLRNFAYSIILVILAQCATDPGTSTPVGGAALTKFTYETGSVVVVVNLDRVNLKISAAAVLFDVNTTTGERTEATELDAGVTVTWPESVTFIIPDCSGTPVLLDAKTYTVNKIFSFRYPDSCAPASTTTVAAIATLSVDKTGQATKVLNGNGNNNSGGGGGGGSQDLTEHTIFITSTNYTGNMIGISGADGNCVIRAASGSATSGLGGTWRALLSTSIVDAKDRVSYTSGAAIKNTNGNTVASTNAGLWNAASVALLATAEYDENGTPRGALSPFTGTLPDGTDDGRNCTDWTSAGGLGNLGVANATTGSWLSVGASNCAGPFPIYCMNSNN